MSQCKVKVDEHSLWPGLISLGLASCRPDATYFKHEGRNEGMTSELLQEASHADVMGAMWRYHSRGIIPAHVEHVDAVA